MNLTSVLLRIINSKIWVEEDRTMSGFVYELLAAGIPHDDILLSLSTARDAAPYAVCRYIA